MSARVWVSVIIMMAVLALPLVGVLAVGGQKTAEAADPPHWVTLDTGRTYNLNGVWSSSARNIYATGTGGTILHYNGSGWSSMASGTTEDLQRVWGVSDTEVYTVGTDDTVLYYDDVSGWTSLDISSGCHLYGVWGRDSEDIYIVGWNNTATDGIIVYGDGENWDYTNTNTDEILYGVWGTDSTDTYVVGSGSTVLHSAGNGWNPIDVDPEDPGYIFVDVWASSDSDIYIVGYTGDATEGVIFHYNGSSWEEIPDTDNVFAGVWGSSSNDVFVVGGDLATGEATILHWNGSAWTEMSNDCNYPLIEISGSPDGDVMTVGWGGSILRKLKPWTFLIYMNGDNNLQNWAIADFDRIAEVGSTENMSIVVQLDRISGSWTTCKRFYVEEGMAATAENASADIGECNMAEPDTLEDFIEWTANNYPAEKYALILWDHGRGWKVSRDETSNDDWMEMDELRRALENASSVQTMDLVGFMACVMATIEGAYGIEDAAPVMVASQETINSGYPWPFDDILLNLSANPGWSAFQLGSAIADNYCDKYGYGLPSTVINLSYMDTLKDAIDNLADTIMTDWDINVSAVQNAAQMVMDEINASILYERHGPLFSGSWDINGLSIFFPNTSEDFSYYEDEFHGSYNDSTLAFLNDTSWDEFLEEFYSTSMNMSWIANARHEVTEFPFGEDPIGHIDLYRFCENLLDTPEWNFMVYNAAHSNAEGLSLDAFLYMAEVGSDANVSVVVQMDRDPDFDISYGDWKDTRRFFVTKDMTPTASNGSTVSECNGSECNMGDPDTLVDFVEWSATHYPTENYALVILGHGDHLVISPDDDVYDDWIEMDELKTALDSISENVTEIDLVMFHACTMGTIEAAYQIRDLVPVLVASEATISQCAVPYDDILDDLTENPDQSATALATDIVEYYGDNCGTEGAHTMSAIALSHMDTLAAKVSSLAETVMDNWGSNLNAVQEAAQSVMDEVNASIISETHGAYFTANGLAIYFPEVWEHYVWAKTEGFQQGAWGFLYNSSCDFAANTSWDDFLRSFFNTSMNQSWVHDARVNTQMFGYYPVYTTDLYHFCENLVNASMAYSTYNYTGVTAASGPHDAYYCDEDDNSPPPALDETTEATDTQYSQISSSDDSRWQSSNPGGGDYTLIKYDMTIDEYPYDVTEIELTFEGYSSRSWGSSTFKIWVYNYATSTWSQLGDSQEISSGSDETMTRSITSNCHDYISGDGTITWGVFLDETFFLWGYLIYTDYVEAKITYVLP